MTRLIDADVLNLLIEANQLLNPKLSVYDVQKIIEGIPTIERPKGKWVIVKDEKWGDNVKCPFCGKELSGTDLNFCCKCGADMREGETND